MGRTGTKSISAALRTAGYRGKHYVRMEHLVDPGFLDAHDFLSDNPIPMIFPLLDRAYPGSRFIYTCREIDSWLDSQRRLALRRAKRRMHWSADFYRQWAFGSVEYDAPKYEAGYERHERVVTEYFRSRPDDLLVMDICAGDGWELLAPFLGCEVTPETPFPWVK